MVPEKLLRHIFWPIGQQRNAEEIFLFGEVDCVLKELPAVTLALVFFMDYQVLEQDHKAALSGADGKQQIDHAHDCAVLS